MLNETSNIIESLKQSVPSLTAFSLPIGTGPAGNVIGNYEGVKDGSKEFYVAGRKNGEWLKLTNESKLFTPNAIINCTPQRDTFAISVLPTPKVDSIANMQVCPGTTVPAINFATPITGSTVGYKWTNSNTQIALGLLAASGFGNIPSFTAGTAQVSTITVTPYILKSATDTCFGTVRTFIINAQQIDAPILTFPFVIYTGSKTLGQLDVRTSATGTLNFYSTSNGGTPLPSSTIVTDNTDYHLTQTIGVCESNYRNTFIANRIANDTIVFCKPDSVANLTATTTAGLIVRWYDVPSGGDTLARSTPITAAQDTLYVDEYGMFQPGRFGVISNRVPVIVMVNPTPANVVATTDKAVCNNSTVAAVNFSTTNTVGATTYAWTNNKTSIGLAASGTGNIASFTAVNNGTAPDTATIIVTPTITNLGLSCEGIKDTFLIIVNPTAAVNTVSNQVVCNGSAVTSINFGTTNTGGTVTYAWTNNTTSIGLAASGTGNIATFNGVNTGTAPVTATIVVTPTFTNGGVSCTGPTKTFTITVNPTVTVNPENDQVLCNGAGSTAINFSTSAIPIAIGSTTTYAWTNDKPGIGLAASGTGNIASFTAVNNGTAPDTATIIVTPTFANGGANCVGTKDTIYIVVNPTANVNTVSNQVVCNGSAVTAINFGTTNTGGTVTYAWTNNTTSIGLAANGNANIATFNGVNTGTAPVTATIVVTPTFTNGGVSCTGPTKTFTITVNPTVTVNLVNDQVLCNTSASAAISFSTPATGGTTTYAWTNDKPGIGLAATGSGNIASFTAVNNGLMPDTATIIVTPTFANGGVNCVGTKDTIYIVVNPTANVNAVNNQVLCNGATVTAVNFGTTNTGGTVTYAWTNNTTNIGLAATGNGNIASFNAVNNSTAPVTATIVVTPTFTNGGVNCTGPTKTFTIIVNPTVVVNTVANQVVCNGAAVTAVNFGTTATGGTTTYAWTNNTTSIGLAASGNGNIATFNGVNNGTAPTTATITVTPTFTNAGVSCVGTPRTFTITVNPTAKVVAESEKVICNNGTLAAINQVLCAGSTNSAVTFSSPVAGSTYTWTNSNPSIGLAAAGTGNIPSFVAVNPSPNAINATITVTPNTPAGCIGQSITYTISVNGLSVAPTAIINPTPIVCANNAFTTLSVNGGALGSGAVWKWYADSLNTVSIGSGSTLASIPVAKTTTYFVRAEGTCNNTAAASVVVQRANLVHHVRQHWADVLLFDNSSRDFVSWQWYKNGQLVPGATLQQYSESNSLVGEYYVIATDKNGAKAITCPMTITTTTFSGLRINLAPNPADKGTSVTISTSFTASQLQGASIAITDINGRVLSQITQVGPTTKIQAPLGNGIFVVTLTLQNGVKYSTNLLTK